MSNIEIIVTSSGARLIAKSSIRQGRIVHQIRDYQVLQKPTYQTVQIGFATHIEEAYLIYMNHSCDPNVIIKANTLECVATRPIKPLEELHFFYPSTEWSMDRPFSCHCGSPQCLQFISGAKSLSLDMLNQRFVNSHIRLQALMHSNLKLEQQLA